MNCCFLRAGLHWPALFLSALVLGGCAGTPRTPTLIVPTREAQLTATLVALNDSVEVHDAAILATVALQTSSELAVRYRVVRPAWLHNVLVNSGCRARGLCHHWAADLQARLAEYHFATLEIHPVIARRGTWREHSAIAVTARGQALPHGVVLDAWRAGGLLAWAPVERDKYPWRANDAGSNTSDP